MIAENASIAGASGGCQAEIGTAAAMAAGALTFLQGVRPGRLCRQQPFALKNMLGADVIRWEDWWKSPVSSGMLRE